MARLTTDCSRIPRRGTLSPPEGTSEEARFRSGLDRHPGDGIGRRPQHRRGNLVRRAQHLACVPSSLTRRSLALVSASMTTVTTRSVHHERSVGRGGSLGDGTVVVGNRADSTQLVARNLRNEVLHSVSNLATPPTDCLRAPAFFGTSDACRSSYSPTSTLQGDLACSPGTVFCSESPRR